MTGIGPLAVQGSRLHVFRNMFMKRSTPESVGLVKDCHLFTKDSVKPCPRLGRFGADCLCFQLRGGWLADKSV